MRRSVMVVCLVACGGESTTKLDGAVEVDAPGGDASDPVVPCEHSGPSGTVTLRGSPAHRGVFHDAGGAVLSQVQFDAQGMATGTIPPCGAVTFMKGASTFFTITHVMPGETITLRYPDRPAAVRHQVSVDFPVHPGATSYAIRPASRGGAFMGCSAFAGSTSPITLDFDDRCIGVDGTISFVAVASDQDGAAAYAAFEGVALAAAGTTSVSVTAWRTDTRAASITFNNLPDPTWTTTARVSLVLGGMYGSNVLIGGTGLPAAGSHVSFSASLVHPQGGRAGVTQLMKVVPPAEVQSLVLDGVQDFAPVVSAPMRDDTDPGHPLVSWTSAATPTASQAIAITAQWTGLDWFVIAPPDQPNALRVPQLPAELRPTTAPRDIAVMVVEFSPLATYADLRRDPLALWFPTLYSDPIDTLVYRISATGDLELPNID